MKQRFHVFNHKIKLNPGEISFNIYRSNTVENQLDNRWRKLTKYVELDFPIIEVLTIHFKLIEINENNKFIVSYLVFSISQYLVTLACIN